MIYKDFNGDQLSFLGFGAMRLPVLDGRDDSIDEPALSRMVEQALAGGINYFDTAWGYHGGNSETCLGRALKPFPRDSFRLATKFPGYSLSSFGRHEEIFERQLQKCQVSYFDFYLLHNLCEMNLDAYLDDAAHGTVSYFKRQRDAGRIRHLGLSVHGTLDTLRRFLEVYGADMAFCQIQLNYLDWEFQNAKEKVALLNEYRIPVWVMEPVRGGRLAKLPASDARALRALRPDADAVSWAFRFVQSVPGVAMILSGMSNEAQLSQNIATFSAEQSLSEAETALLLDIAARMTRKTSVPCTGCRYCVSQCPQELDIPRMMELYNEHSFTRDGAFIAPMALSALAEDKRPDACIGCGACAAVCPQQIAIPAVIADFADRIDSK